MNTPKPESSSARLPAIPSLEDSFHSEFEDSLNYLSSIAEKNKRVAHNATLKQYPSYDPGASSMSIPMRPGIGDEMTRAYLEGDPSHHVDLGIPEVFAEVPPLTNQSPPMTLRSATKPPEAPPYGCLKNGTKPTYRYWKNQTQRAMPTPVPVSANAPLSQPAPFRPPSSYAPNMETVEIHQQMERRKKDKAVRPRLPPKQKRTLTRTFFLGKSKHYPRVGVLVSNKTIRKETSSKIQKLRHTPIEEVRRALIRKGLIKVGSNAPVDVLRKMYESIFLVCGEVQNHNPENLLYNYLNAPDF